MQTQGEPGLEFPYPLAERTKILGVILDRRMQCDPHLESLLTKAQLRQSILRRVAGCKWGLEVGILSMTLDAIIGNLLRYALAVMGAHLPWDLSRKIGTCITNVAARKVLGVDQTARIETLHFVAGTQTFFNMVVMHLAEYLDLVLRAHNSTIRTRVLATLRTIYNVESFEPERTRIEAPVEEYRRQKETNTTTERIWRHTSWHCLRYPKNRSEKRIKNICSMYVNYSQEMRTSLPHKEETYQFEDTENWKDAATQILQQHRKLERCSNAAQNALNHGV